MKPSAYPGDRDKGMVRLYAWVMIVAAGLTVLVALQATRTDPQYSSSAEVLIDPTITPSGNYIQPSMPTEQRVATSTDVVGTAAARLGVTTGTALGHLTVTVPVDTQILVMTYTADTPAAALSGAQAIAQTYIKNRNPADGKNVVASLVGPPKLPSTPVATNYPVVLGVALLGGLLIGFGAAWTWDRVRGRIRTLADVERLTKLDTLAVLPRPSWAAERRGSVGRRSHLESLAARVLSQVDDKPRPSVLVTGVDLNCDTTTVAAQTALTLARMGRVVILVTAHPDPISSLSSHRESALETQPEGLHIMTVGGWASGGLATAELTNLLRDPHDRLPEALLIIDAPPAWQSAGMALRADRILLVAALGRSSRTSAGAATQALDHCSEKLMGLVITSPRRRAVVALASVRTWAARQLRRVMSRVAPPAPTTSAPQGPRSGVRVPLTGAPRLNGSAPRSVRWPARGVPPTLRGWTGLMGGEDQLSGLTAPDRFCLVGRGPAPQPNGKAAQSSPS